MDTNDLWWAVPLGAGYLGAAAWTTRRFFQNQYTQWMEKEIHSRLTWAEKNGREENPETVRRDLHSRFRRQQSDSALLISVIAGFIWPLTLPIAWVTKRPEPGEQERLLMDRAAYARLQELERQAGLTPLESPGESA